MLRSLLPMYWEITMEPPIANADITFLTRLSNVVKNDMPATAASLTYETITVSAISIATIIDCSIKIGTNKLNIILLVNIPSSFNLKVMKLLCFALIGFSKMNISVYLINVHRIIRLVNYSAGFNCT